MYIIVENKPYAIKDDKVYEVSFGDNGTIKIGEEVDIKIEGKRYSIDEIKRKFNFRYLLEQKNDPKNALIKENEELKAKIEELTKEIETLKAQQNPKEGKVVKDEEKGKE